MRIWIANCCFFLFLLAFYFGCASESKEIKLNSIKDLKTRQYAVAGQELYLIHCANCHQADGSGLGLVIPPLKDADYLKEDIARSVRIIRYGQKGEILVNGATYNQPMPANPQLKPIEIAQIATYIHTLWGSGEQLISIDSVNVYLK
jgi:cytochrome c551